MKLNINDFAKIRHADIIVDGITIIAGENDTGKSTVGKILFSIFNSVSGIEDKILKQRVKEIEENSQLALRNYMMQHDRFGNLMARNVSVAAKKIAHQILGELERPEHEEKQIEDLVRDSVRRVFKEYNIENAQEIYDEVIWKITKILKLPEYTIMLEIISRYFNGVFHGQINSLVEQGTNATLDLNVKSKGIQLSFRNNQCVDYKSEITLLHKAIYIDNPFIIDKLDDWNVLNTMDQFLKELLTDSSNDDIMNGIIETVLAKEKLHEIYEVLQSVVKGEVITQKEDEFYLETEGVNQSISFHNLSTGLKSFVVIKMLVEKGLIKEKDIIVLDEPEIHLHPQWQVSYAELIVLLQKYFDLSIIVTTHSPYFLDAINLFSVKHGLSEKVNYYLSAIEDNRVKMTNVTDNMDLIYQKMASPIQMLDSLRHELNN